MRIVISIILTFLSFVSMGQTDTLFWFAAPEVTSSHADRPVYLRVCTFDKEASVKISQPANPSFQPVAFTVKANSTYSLDLTSRLAMLENAAANTPLNTGLLIETSASVTAYYEVLGNSPFYGDVNTDIFTLKGRYALGKEFFTPFQNYWDNENTNTDGAYSSFDIVATEDNTEITITPSNDIVGHPAGVPFTIVLNRGQVYSARAISQEGEGHLHGSHISSTKPVAVTVKDDSILEGSHYDLLGDQLVPVEHTGMEYIAVRISGQVYNLDLVFITATEDSTLVFQDGSPVASDTLQRGETGSFSIPGNASYFRSTKPVYAWHVGGFGFELGAALLPEISCTGSSKVRFTRSNDESFALNILVKTAGISDFLLNGRPLSGGADNFSEVPGTQGEWSYAKLGFPIVNVSAGSSNLLQNLSTEFHLGILNGEATGTSFRYGYFSSFGYGGLSGDMSICSGETVHLDAGDNVSGYLWSTGETSRAISVQDSGTYWVRVTKGLCEFTDTVEVSLDPDPEKPDLGPDTSICNYETLNLQAHKDYEGFLWNTGSTEETIVPRASGLYWLEVSNEFGCKASDSVDIAIHARPDVQIILSMSEEEACKDSVVTLSATSGNFSYLWHNGDTTIATDVFHNQVYSVKVTDEYGCQDSTSFSIDCSPFIEVFNLMTPNGDGLNERFFVRGLKPGKWTLEMFNRWGGRVYFNGSYDNSWKAENLEDGVYYYVLKHNEGKRVLNGYIRILR